MNYYRGKQYVPDITMPFEIAFEPAVFHEPGCYLPGINAAARKQYHQNNHNVNHGSDKYYARFYQRGKHRGTSNQNTTH
jgi:hypothetical protein